MRRGLSSSHPVPGACSSGLPNARRRSPDAWRARRAWSRAAARSGALTPPWPRSASASAARVTVTKHSAPPCHNKSPGAPAAGDPYPRLAAATTLRGCTGWAAGAHLEGSRASPHRVHVPTRDCGRRPELAPHRILRGRSLTSVPPPPGCLCWCHASNPHRRAATRRASGRSRGQPGGPRMGQRCCGVPGGTRGRSGRAETGGGHAEAVPALPAGAGRREQGVGLGGRRSLPPG